MAVCVHRGLHLLMPEPLGNEQGRAAHLHQQARVAVPDIVYADAFDPGDLAAVLHLVVEKMLRVREQPVAGLEAVALFHVPLQTSAQDFRHRDHPVAFGSLGRGDHVLVPEPLVTLADGDDRLFKVDVRRSQSQQLALSHTGVVQRHKCGVGGGPVFQRFNELRELVPRPEQHLVRRLFAHAPGLVAGVFLQTVILDRVVEDGGYLVVDDPEIGLGIRLALVVAVAGQLVLPAPYVSRLDLVERHPAEEGRYLEVDHEPFVGQSRGLEPLLHVLKVEPDEVLKRHPEAGIRPAYEVALPLQRLAFGVEAALLLVHYLKRSRREPR